MREERSLCRAEVDLRCGNGEGARHVKTNFLRW